MNQDQLLLTSPPASTLADPGSASGSFSLFQILALSFLAAMLAWEIWRLFRGARPRLLWLFRFLIWLAAALAIAMPAEVSALAHALGIGRGADVVLYVFVLAFLATSFYWYSRHLLLERQLTEIVRHLAIQEARRGSKPSDTTPLQ